MAKGKDVLTTGDVAKICHVAPRTVSKWFDNGKLRAYRMPGNNDRRIPVSELISFVRMHNISTRILPVGKIRVLIADCKDKTASALVDILRSEADFEVKIVRSNFGTGELVQKFAPHVLLESLLFEDIDAMSICKCIRDDEDFDNIKIIALVNDLSESQSGALLQKDFDGYASHSADANEIIKKIEEATAIIN